MFESITKAVLAHKQIVIAAIAVSGLVGYGFLPALPSAAYAQLSLFFNGIGINLNERVSVDTDGVSVDVGPYGLVAVTVDGVEVDVNDGVRVNVGGLSVSTASSIQFSGFGSGFLP